MTTVSDDELMAMFRAKDADAFSVLFARHHVSVYNFARSILGDSHTAEEVMQDTFLTVARTAEVYAPMGRFRAWVLKITRNKCLNRLESERALRRESIDEGGGGREPAAPGPSADEEAAQADRAQAIQRALAELPERQREVMTLYGFEQMRYREIAQVLDMPINTVKTLIHRARATLATRLDALRKESQ